MIQHTVAICNSKIKPSKHTPHKVPGSFSRFHRQKRKMKKGKRKAISKLSFQGKKFAMKHFRLKHSRNFLNIERNFADFLCKMSQKNCILLILHQRRNSQSDPNH